MNTKKGNILLFILVIIGIVFLIIFCFGIKQVTSKYKKGDEVYSSINELMSDNSSSSDDKDGTDVFDDKKKINWNKLKKINLDIIGWIEQEDTVIDYPIVQGNDNDFYLHHMPDKSENYYVGSVFLDAKNISDFSNKFNVIYAHCVQDGSHFYSLQHYQNQKYYDEHPKFKLYTPKKNYDLVVVAGNVLNGDVPYLQFDFANDIEYLQYLSAFVENSTFDSNVNIDASDRVVMLSTCMNSSPSDRYALLCILEEVEDEDE